MKNWIPLLAGVCALPACLYGLPHVFAQDAYPTRAVHIVVPYTPGTGADILSRVLGPKLSERWKAAVVTDNRPGATGNIGADAVAKSAPDGYTLLLTATSFATNPALSRGELSDLARKEPGKLYYSSPGNGGPQHLAMELLKLETGIDMVHVPYKGAGGAIADLVGGHVQAMISALQTVAPHVQSGRLRMLGVMSAERAPAFPEVPTLKEQGLPDLEVETWYAMFAPAGTPAAIVERVNREINELLKDGAVKDVLANQGLVPAGGPPQRLGALLARELPRWKARRQCRTNKGRL